MLVVTEPPKAETKKASRVSKNLLKKHQNFSRLSAQSKRSLKGFLTFGV